MPSALVPLANLTLASSAATVTFSSISGSYRDLLIVASGKSASGEILVAARLNGDTGSNYSRVGMYGDGTNASSASGSGQGYAYIGMGVYTFDPTDPGMIITHIMDYSATDKHKTLLSRYGNGSSQAAGAFGTGASVVRWASTSAVTSVVIFDVLGNSFASGTTFALYGVSA